MEITREELYNNSYEEVINQKTITKEGIKDFIKDNKIIFIGLLSFTIISVTNIILIYNFFITLNKL